MSLRSTLQINAKLLPDCELQGLALAEDMWDRAGRPITAGPLIAVIEEILQCSAKEGVIYPRVLLLRKKELQHGRFELLLTSQNPNAGDNNVKSKVCPLCRDTGVVTNTSGSFAALGRIDKLQVYFSIQELANRWRCSRPTVYNRLRSVGAQVLDFATPGKKGKKVVSAKVVRQIESKKTKRFV